MKRKAPLHGKEESADIQSGAAAEYDSPEKRAEKRIERTETKPNDRIIELRNRIRSGYYNSKEVLLEIVNKLLKDIKEPKE